MEEDSFDLSIYQFGIGYIQKESIKENGGEMLLLGFEGQEWNKVYILFCPPSVTLVHIQHTQYEKSGEGAQIFSVLNW